MTSGDNIQRGLKNTVDWKLVICYLLLVLIGWVNIFSAVQSGEPSSIFDLNCNSGRQFLWMIVSFVFAIFILFFVNPKIWEVISRPAYLVVLVLLVAVIFLSRDVKGSHSWFQFGSVKFQPAEISKITTSLLLAAYMGRPNFKLSSRHSFLRVALILGMPMLSIVAESETGSALVYLGFLFVLYREGLSGWIFAYIAMAILLFIVALRVNPWVSLAVLTVCVGIYLVYVLRHSHPSTRQRRSHIWITVISFLMGVFYVLMVPFVFNQILKEHQRDRIMVLLGIKEDLQGAGYNVHQSLIAIGSGGFSGKGFLGGTQTSYGFVPEQSTDFIFCTVGEEWGFLGCMVVIFLYSFLIFRIIHDAEQGREAFTRIYGYCLASCLFMHLFINIGMTVGLMPVIGIPLPLLSYGGSSLLAFTVMIFIFLALDRQEKKYF